MAQMIPDINPAEITNIGEKIVYSAFKEQLPEKWIVRYSYDCCLYDNGHFNDGEADFIVAAPEFGLMFVEVKGNPGYEYIDGQWYNIEVGGNREKRGNPFLQAKRTKHTIINHFSKLLNRNKNQFPGIYGHVVVYPNAKIKNNLPYSQDKNIIFTHSDMTNMKECMIGAFKDWTREAFENQFGQYFNTIVKYLREKSEFVPVAAADSDEEERRIEELTKIQYNTFKAIRSNKRIHVKGVAGSGKTIIATWAANALVKEEKKVLYLCYNTALASWMNSMNLINKKKLDFKVNSFLKFCSHLSRSKNLEFRKNDGENDFYKKRAVDITLDAIEKMSTDEKYDAIFVDEAQDFYKDWWFVVESLLKDGDDSSLYLFYDPKQVLYNNDKSFPRGTLCELDQNCRNTKKISSFCGKVIHNNIEAFQFAPEGISPEITEPLPDLQQRKIKVKKIVQSWLNENYTPSRIAILSPWIVSNDKNSLKDLDKIGTVKLESNDTNIDSWLNGQTIWSKTIKSFKGIEADCIVITDIPKIGTIGFKEEDLYVAASRAKSRLVLIPASQEAAEDLKKCIKQL